MPFGLIISLACHVALIGWAYLSMRDTPPLPSDETPAISAELITPSEFLSLKKGSEDAKKLETKVNDKPTEDESKNDTKKPDTPPPAPSAPPPQELAKAEPVEPPKAAEPEQFKKIEPPKEEPKPEPPRAETPPEPKPGPTPEEQKLLEQKLLEEQKAAEDAKKKAAEEEEAKKKAEEEAKKKAEEDAKKNADEEAKKKKLAEDLKKKKAEEARKKAEAEKKKFDVNKIASLLKDSEEAPPKALIDKDPNKKGQRASGSSQTATAIGKEAGTATGTAPKLSAREQDLLKGMIKTQLSECWRLPGAGGGENTPVVTLRWRMKPDGTLDGAPQVQQAPSDPAGQVAAEAAMRAVKTCEPFHLPPDNYSAWKDVIWVFDPRQML